MSDAAPLSPISEGMMVISSDGQPLGLVRTVWGGFADLGSALEMERATGVGAPLEGGAELHDLPEGTTPVGETVPGYLEVVAFEEESNLYIPLADVAEVTGDQVLLQRPLADIATGIYSRSPSRT